MDIPVSRLNERIALRLPAQFPLGLVFVVGTVEGIYSSRNGDLASAFYLLENDSRLRCRLSERASSETHLKNGYRIRAGGHLEFDSRRADYYLLARDVEIIPLEQPRVSSMAAIIADHSMRSEEAGLIPAELPEWVKRMAPSGIGTEAERSNAVTPESIAVQPVVSVEGVTRRQTGLLGLGHEAAAAGLSDELIEFLSEAMDSEEDIELTPELVADFNQQGSGANPAINTAVDGSPGNISPGNVQPYEYGSDDKIEDLDDAELGGRKKRRFLWIIILALMILALSIGALAILQQYVV